jgi:predicted  nucleic acid-binding Zn-ribbon protein
MRHLKLNPILIMLLVGVGATAAQPCLGAPDLLSRLFAALEQARVSLNETSLKLGFVEQSTEFEGANIARLEEAYRAGMDPAEVARELEAATKRLDQVKADLIDIPGKLQSIRGVLERIGAEARRMRARKLMMAVERAIAFHDALHDRVTDAKKKLISVREAMERLADEIEQG